MYITWGPASFQIVPICCYSCSFHVCSFRTFIYYTWQEPLDLGLQNLNCFISNLWLIPEIWRTPDASQAAPSTGSARRQHRDHKQRQAKRGQLTAKLKLTPCRISLPNIFLANMVNKMDELQLWIHYLLAIKLIKPKKLEIFECKTNK